MITPIPENSAILALYSHIYIDRQAIDAITQSPAEHGLKVEGLGHTLLQCHLNDQGEEEIIKALQDLNLEDEQDTIYQNSLLHWCAVLNYPNVAHFLTEEGVCNNETRNKAGFLSSQLAAFHGNIVFLENHLSQTGELNTTIIECETPEAKVAYELNELHWAILGGHLAMVQSIFRICTEYNQLIVPEIKGIGNLLHLIIYAGLLEEKLPMERRVSNYLLSVVLNYSFTGKTFAGLLQESASNYENCTPLMLIAKKGQVDKLKQFIDHMRYQLEESASLEQIEKAFYLAVREGQVEVVKVLLNYYHFIPSNTHTEYNDCISQLKIQKANNANLQKIYNLMTARSKLQKVKQFNPSKPQEQCYENLVLSGGGGKGFVYPYALKHFKALCQKRQDNEIVFSKKDALGFSCIKRIVGTSAGSIFALGLAVGHEPEDLESYLDVDYAEFLENIEVDAILQQIDSGNGSSQDIMKSILKALNLNMQQLIASYQRIAQSQHPVLSATWEGIRHPFWLYREAKQLLMDLQKLNQFFRGFSSGQKALVFLQQLLTDKGLKADITFGELAEKIKQQPGKYKHLYVVVTNLTRGIFEVLSTENPAYKDYLIVDAVRASMSYPVIFVPHRLKEKKPQGIINLPDEYIDGGVLRNYAIDEFDFKKYTQNNDARGDSRYPELNRATIGFQLVNETLEQVVKPADSVMNELMCFAHLYMKAEALISKHLNKDYHRSIIIDTGKISTFSFKKLQEEDKQALKLAGEKAVNEFFTRSGNKQTGVYNPRGMFSQPLLIPQPVLSSDQENLLNEENQEDKLPNFQ